MDSNPRHSEHESPPIPLEQCSRPILFCYLELVVPQLDSLTTCSTRKENSSHLNELKPYFFIKTFCSQETSRNVGVDVALSKFDNIFC